MSDFSDPEVVASYAEGPARLVPGFRDLQRMADILLAERAPENASILVLGAGGGLELKVFADLHANWHFVGVDPSADMLDLAKKTVGDHAARMEFCEGYISDAPVGPFDGAACILTMHFVPREERLETLINVRERLKPGAPFVVAHHSFPQDEAGKELWLNRYAAFGISSGVPADKAKKAAAAIAKRLPTLSPDQEESSLRDAGFTDVALFYAGFSFRGWVGYAP